ncbi:uncharacterized protein TOT_010000827 [Theileria orientalis strain Shintoku]|uniref:RRM domain-containing protein n=1 Tax=Theileria orientalis strain Shintoku TaxID=869250 RepID=J4D664_THEOR|nr:uncharacterized protein TOT_010000827 [Theileria orientalis strain Shintoku]BAM39370.1 uncharacterized protein TOT_010000827 [Theileria orientalis strain Shintoku]|eukprot:XP_009689671.1 uncharacterized protein TOT_010000827 [Theileria orientalis strain Shintoku]
MVEAEDATSDTNLKDNNHSINSNYTNAYNSSVKSSNPGSGNHDPASLLSENDYESNKIFAGGLCRTTTAEQLRSYFESFGKVTETEVVKDKITGRSRGFGFVTFASNDSVQRVLSQEHTVNDVQVEVKLAVRKEKSKILAPKYDQTKRIFVGGIAENVTESYFKDYFGRYGQISSHNFLMDKRTNKPRGYGFVIYENVDDAEKSIGQHPSLGKFCEAKFAQPKADDKFQTNFQNFDYSAYYYAQANLLYSQYLSQMYNGYGSDALSAKHSSDRPSEDSGGRRRRSRGSSLESRGGRFDDRRRKKYRSRSPRRDRRSRSRSRRRYRR